MAAVLSQCCSNTKVIQCFVWSNREDGSETGRLIRQCHSFINGVNELFSESDEPDSFAKSCLLEESCLNTWSYVKCNSFRHFVLLLTFSPSLS